MSRQIAYRVTYKNGVTRLGAGLFNNHGAEHYTSHFNGSEKEKFLKEITIFESENTKVIRHRELVFYVSTCQTSDGIHRGTERVKYSFPEFRRAFDSIFEQVNSWKGGRV